MPDTYKVGFTNRDPIVRARELSRESGVPCEFVVEFSVICKNAYEVEQAIHLELDEHRVNQSREFFTGALDDIRQVVMKQSIDEDVSKEMTKYIALEIAAKDIEIAKLKLQIAAMTDSVSSLVGELKLAREENDDLAEELEKSKAISSMLRNRLSYLFTFNTQ